MDDDNHKTGWAHGLIDSAKTFAIVVAIMLVPRTVLCQPFTIPSASMEPTLLVGDYILVSKFPYGISRHSAPFSPPLGKGRLFGHEPARGDVVVFKRPGDGRTDVIKRLVGFPGDRIQVVGGCCGSTARRWRNGRSPRASRTAPTAIRSWSTRWQRPCPTAATT
jgi:signal peptidase I